MNKSTNLKKKTGKKKINVSNRLEPYVLLVIGGTTMQKRRGYPLESLKALYAWLETFFRHSKTKHLLSWFFRLNTLKVKAKSPAF